MKSVRIEDISEFVLDGTHGSPVRTETGVPVLSAQNVKNGFLSYETDRYTSIEEFRAFESRLPLKVGDVLLTIVGTIGRAAVLTEVRPLVFQRSVAVIRPKAEVADSRFFFHATQTHGFQTQLAMSANQSSQAGVYLGKLKEVRIVLPPLAEQRRIAEVLDRAEALRAKRRAALAQLDTLTQSIFLDMFGDPEGKIRQLPTLPLDEFCTVFSGFAWKSDRFSKDPVGLPVIRIQNVDAMRDLDFVYWPDSFDERFVIHRGDLLLTLSGSFRVAEWTGPDALLNQRIVRITPRAGVERLWLLHGVRLLVARIEALGRHALVNNVALSDLKQLRLVSSPIELQREFSRRVAAVEKLKAAHCASLSELDALFASLQQRAFRGDL